MATNPAFDDHQAWLGYLQPEGLVVSATALVDAQVVIDRNCIPLQQRFLDHVDIVTHGEDEVYAIPDFHRLLLDFLDWPQEEIVGLPGGEPIPESLKVAVAEGQTLEPTLALRRLPLEEDDGKPPWMLLVREESLETDLDSRRTDDERGWSASQAQRFERLLRETQVPIGILTNQRQIRLIYAPRGENAGSITFPVAAMTEVAGRTILAALHLLLDVYRLYSAPDDATLPALLAKSRDIQSSVSSALSQQVLAALYELLRGFQAADDRASGELLRQQLKDTPNAIYEGLLTVLMRLVFLLYAEDRSLMPGSDVYVRHYSVHGLFERLRGDHANYPDTMDSRYGAWAQLAALFRVVYAGCKHPLMAAPARHGHLFEPERFPFLDGAKEDRLPRVADGTVYRVLSNLLILKGERLSYRTLDVEQIGSVYETMIGFHLQLAAGTTIAIRPVKSHGAPVPINLDTLLATAPGKRAAWIQEQTDQKLTATIAKPLKEATTIDGLLVALQKKVSRRATPHPIPRGAMVLQPTDERRRSGSHYTPRSLTEPIVRTTLRPILDRLGAQPMPSDILDLKICDPACGSGAFLVEACRQLGDELVKAWHTHDALPVIPDDEDELLHARRVVAQRCLYGVDRNPMAVDLTKLSLWLATLAKDHPFTFLDHCVRCGDSLVGLTSQQIIRFHWDDDTAVQQGFGQDRVATHLENATNQRREILAGGDYMHPLEKRQRLAQADSQLQLVRFAGDLIIAAFFNGKKKTDRNAHRDDYLQRLNDYLATSNFDQRPTEVVDVLRSDEHPVWPFHWEIEYPEVFTRRNPGFDAFVGNPPFVGGSKISSSFGSEYLDWIISCHQESHGKSDLVAHFFRRSFNLLRKGGAFGLITTNTISQGETRQTGLRWICNNGGIIFFATRRFSWPGEAAVVASIVHISNVQLPPPFYLDRRSVPRITAYLFHEGSNENPRVLVANHGKSFHGPVVLGMGFTFDDSDNTSVATPISELDSIIENDSRNGERVFPYIGGEEVNKSPTHEPRRFIIDFGDMTEEMARSWPDLFSIVERKVKPYRSALKRDAYRIKWWLFGERQPSLYRAIRDLDRVIVISRVGQRLAFTFMPKNVVWSDSLVVIALREFSDFCMLQSRPHETWARFFSSSMKDDLRYTHTDCFETFPFPERGDELERCGQRYFEFRANLMKASVAGLTDTYNRFHDPLEQSPEIEKLRELHAEMDRAVLESYGWSDLAAKATCEFLLDYEEEDDGKKSRKKKPWRLRWPDEFRDEVLARLLELNEQRHQEELLAGEAPGQQAGPGKSSKAAKGRKAASDNHPTLGI